MLIQFVEVTWRAVSIMVLTFSKLLRASSQARILLLPKIDAGLQDLLRRFFRMEQGAADIVLLDCSGDCAPAVVTVGEAVHII